MRPRDGTRKVMRVLAPPEGRMSLSSPRRKPSFSTTIPVYSSSTSTCTSSTGSSRWPVSGSWRKMTRGRPTESSKPSAHGLDQHAQLQLAAARHLIGVPVFAFSHPDGDIALGFAQQAGADHAAGHLVALAPGEWRIVHRE